MIRRKLSRTRPKFSTEFHANNAVLSCTALSKLALAISLASLPQLSPMAEAATINVNAGCSLRDAIISANEDSAAAQCTAGNDADTIMLSSGTTTFANSEAGVNILGGSALPVINSEITLQGDNSVLRRSYSAGTPNFRLLTVGTNGHLHLDDVDIRNGNAISGGGILCNEGELSISDSTVFENTSTLQGGGIAILRCSLTLTNNTRITGNYAGYGGGGIYSQLSYIDISDSSFYTNEAPLYHGGGMLASGSAVTVSNLVSRFNFASAGGSIFIENAFNSTIAGSEFFGDSATVSGGAIASSNSFTTVTGSNFSNHRAGEEGGAITSRGSLFNLRSSQISNSSVTAGPGGGFFAFLNTVTIQDTTMTSNTASASGGALYAGNNTLTLSNSHLLNNESGLFGGAVFIAGDEVPTRLNHNTFSANYSSGSGGALAISASTDVRSNRDRFIKNTADSAAGILLRSNSEVTINQSTMQSNSAATNAGGILIESSIATISNSTISNNSASSAAGISATDGSNLGLNNSTVSQNSVSFAIGGINLSSSSISLTHSTVVQNSGGNYASGIYRGGVTSDVFLVNSIVAANGVNDCNANADSVLQGNWFGDTSCDGEADGDPQLGPLENNGGPTLTHALLAGSDAIDLAFVGFCESPNDNLDQRGFRRDEHCDSGAFEFGASEDAQFFVIPLPNGKSAVVPL